MRELKAENLEQGARFTTGFTCVSDERYLRPVPHSEATGLLAAIGLCLSILREQLSYQFCPKKGPYSPRGLLSVLSRSNDLSVQRLAGVSLAEG